MAPQIARYATLRFQPYPSRSEHLNYGIVVFSAEGEVSVHLTSSLQKIKAFAPGQSIAKLREHATEIPKLVERLELNKAVDLLNAMRILRNQQIREMGVFSYRNQAEFSENIKLALSAQCDAKEPAKKPREPRSRLYLEVKERFKVLGMLASTYGELPDHQVIAQYAPDPNVDVRVEFALQNGILRIAQTIDLRTGTSDTVTAQHRNAAFSKAYAIHAAKSLLEDSRLRSYVITAGADSEMAQKILTPIENDADHIIRWEDDQEMEKFFTEWAAAAGKELPTVPYAGH